MSKITKPLKGNDFWRNWGWQVYRRIERWWTIDPEYLDQTPTHQNDYRPPPKANQGANIARQQFMKEFHVKYYKRDFRLGGDGDREQNKFKILWRDEVLMDPIRLHKGETVGPFFGENMEKKIAIVFPEHLQKQVYTYNTKSTFPFKPKDRPDFSPGDYLIEEQQKLAQAQIKK
jgi:hypothetical protein